MTRTPRLAFLAVLAALTLLLTACGGGDGSDVANDPGATSTPEPTPTEASPTAAPTVGTYPAFAAEDYTYTLALACFCAGGGTPIHVTVEDGEVVDAVYAGDGRGVEAGSPADQFMWVSINDIIDAANDTGAADVQVDWPAGQDYPNSVYVDRDQMMADEEIGYQVSAVVPGENG